MPETFPFTGLIHHLAQSHGAPELLLPRKASFPTAGCHGNAELRIPFRCPASSLDQGG